MGPFAEPPAQGEAPADAQQPFRRWLAEIGGQVARHLHLSPSVIEKIGAAVADLELSEEEAQRIEAAINTELRRIYAERHVAATMHRVAHDPIAIVPLRYDKHKTREQQEAKLKRHEFLLDPDEDPAPHGYDYGHKNELDDCPDCGRSLQGARLADGSGSILICARLAGLRILLPGLTPNDIVACGLES